MGDARRCGRTRAALVGLGALSLAGYGLGFRSVLAQSDRTATAYVALFGGLFLVYLAAIALAVRPAPRDPVLLVLILGFGLAFRLVLLGTPVVLSSDVYRYLWDGRVQRAGINPYRYPPAAPELAALRDADVYPHINRPASRTIYPPATQALFAAVAAFAPDSLLAWRLLLLAAEAGTITLLLALLRRLGEPPSAVLVYAWAPLAVFEGVQAGHLEVALVPVVLLALTWRQAGHLGRAGLALGAAVLMKLYPAVLLAALWRPGDRRLLLACGGVVVAGYLAYLPGAGPHVLGFLPQYFGSAEDFNLGLRFFLTGWMPVGGDVARETLRGVTMLVLLGALGGVLWRLGRKPAEDARGVCRAGMTAVAAYLLLVPTAMHAWYVVWIVPFLAVERSPAWLWFTGAVSLSYLTYGGVGRDLPLPARALEYLPLYALLVWEWRQGRCSPPRGAAGLVRSGA